MQIRRDMTRENLVVGAVFGNPNQKDQQWYIKERDAEMCHIVSVNSGYEYTHKIAELLRSGWPILTNHE